MDLSNYIEQLLFANDCVIIPNIGGFIVNYEAAKIDFVAQELVPPGKTVSFNPKLVNNDGLLANFLVQREQINYKKAAQKVELWSTQIEQDLFNKKIVHFPKIGKLYFNSDSKLEFVPAPTNFLLEVYGMPAIDCHPILRNKEYLQKETTAATTTTKEAATATTALVPTKKKRGLVLPMALSPKLMGAAAVALLLLASPYWFGGLFNNNTVENTTPLAEKTTTVKPTNTDNKAVDQTPKEDSPAINTTSTASILPIGGTTTTNTAEEKVAETTPTTTAVAPKETPKETIVATTPNNNAATTYVVVLGAFGKKQNATRLSKKLAKDNYQALIELTASGLHRVGVEINCNPSEFPTHFKFIKDNYNKKAWVVE